MKKLLALLLVLVMGASFAACSASQDTPEDVLEAWEEAYNDRDAELLHDISEDGRLGKPVSEYKKLFERREEKYGEDFEVELNIISIEKEGSDRAVAEVELIITSDKIGREVEEDNVGLEKVDGKWYIID